MNTTSLRYVFPFFIVIIIDALGFGMMAPLLAPMITASHGMLGSTAYMQHLLYGVVLAAFPLSYMMGAPFLGLLSDHYGRRNVLFVCLIGALIGFVFYALSFLYASAALLILGRIIAGCASGSQGVAQAAMADISYGKEKAVNIGIIAVGLTIGLVTGPLLAAVLSNSQLVSWFSLATPFYFVIVLSVVNLFLLFYWIPAGANSLSRAPRSGARVGVRGVLLGVKAEKTRSLLIIFFLFELGWSLYYQSLALFLAKTFHYGTAQIGFFSTYVGVALCMSLIILVRVCVRWFNLKKVVSYALFIGMLSLFFLVISPNIFLQSLLAIPITAAVALIYTLLITFLSDSVASNEQGLLMGITDAVLSFAFAITGFLSGWLAYFSVYLPFILASFFWLVAGSRYYFYSRKKMESECYEAVS